MLLFNLVLKWLYGGIIPCTIGVSSIASLTNSLALSLPICTYMCFYPRYVMPVYFPANHVYGIDGLRVENVGNTPTFETRRAGTEIRTHIDVTFSGGMDGLLKGWSAGVSILI